MADASATAAHYLPHSFFSTTHHHLLFCSFARRSKKEGRSRRGRGQLLACFKKLVANIVVSYSSLEVICCLTLDHCWLFVLDLRRGAAVVILMLGASWELFVLLSTTKSRLVIHRSCCCFVTFTGTDMIINNCVEKDTKSSFCNEFALSNYHTSTRLALEAWKYCRYSTSYY